MKKYSITLFRTVSTDFDVEANNPDEVKEIVQDLLDAGRIKVDPEPYVADAYVFISSNEGLFFEENLRV